MSPEWSGRPSASTEVCPAQKTNRSTPLTLFACTQPTSSCHVHGLTTCLSMTNPPNRLRKTRAVPEDAVPDRYANSTVMARQLARTPEGSPAVGRQLAQPSDQRIQPGYGQLLYPPPGRRLCARNTQSPSHPLGDCANSMH